MFLAYHITRRDDLGSILAEGLVPSTGPRSQMLGELRPAVYLFTSFDNMDNALYNWLGEIFEDEDADAGYEIERVALEVEVEDDSLFVDPDEFYEIALSDTVPPDRIRVLEGYPV